MSCILSAIKKSLKIPLSLVLLGILAFPLNSSATKYAGEFMSMGGGARAMGMGGAYAAIAGDASAVFWNPAGISGIKRRQALLMHSEKFGQLLNYNFAAYVMPFNLFTSEDREAALGFALIHQGVDDIVITNNLVYEERNGIPGFQPEDGDRLPYDISNLKSESYNDFALFTSFALKTAKGRIGGTLKLLYTDAIAGYSSMGIGLDFGYLLENLYPNFNVGLKLQDITGTYMSWSSGTNEFIAPSVVLGTSYLIKSPSLNGSLLLAMDGQFYFENRKYVSQFWIGRTSADLHLGAEMRFQERVMVRGGIDAGNATAGAGLRWGYVGFDYAYLHHASSEGRASFEATHRVSAFAEF